VEARKAFGTYSSSVQRKETTSGPSSDKVHVHESGAVLILTGDSGHEKGGTRELKVSGDVHSPHRDT
jgi:hypothetical protein